MSTIRSISIIGLNIDPANDNADVEVTLTDGRSYSFLVATPTNLPRLMSNEGLDYFVSFPPPVIVQKIDEQCLRRAVEELFQDSNPEMLSRYGVRQSADAIVNKQ